MKNPFLTLTIVALLFSACGNSQTEVHSHDHEDHPAGTHTHDDGTVHSNHEETASPQEEFNVKSDSIPQDSLK